MTSNQINNTVVKKWMIISWRYNGFLDGDYGKLMETIEGTYEDAAKRARDYVESYSPVGVCGVIE